MSQEIRVVFVTVSTEEDARELAERLVGEGLAACVNLVGPVTSVYRWEGRIQQDPEILLVIKTTEARLKTLTSRVAELHRYEVPEIIALSVSDGWPPYLDWVRKETAAEER